MEDSKRIHKFFARDGKVFLLWSVRTRAALEDKECINVVERDYVGNNHVSNLSEDVRSKVAEARAIIIQGLGDKPLRTCLGEKDNPYHMWIKLRERYAVANIATRVQLQSKLARMRYSGQTMSDYVGSFEENFNRLTAMNSTVEEACKLQCS